VKTITCKIPESLNTELQAAAMAEGVSKSHVMRRALEKNLAKRPGKKSPRAFDLVKDLSGSLKGPSDLLTNPKYTENFGS
jgi:hypothetical protein